MKTSELTGPALDWAVAKCEGVALVDGCIFTKDPEDEQVLYSPSTDWAQAGPIIERERMTITYNEDDGCWEAYYPDHVASYQRANSPLIAAMRCYVASVLGGEVEIPEELK